LVQVVPEALVVQRQRAVALSGRQVGIHDSATRISVDLAPAVVAFPVLVVVAARATRLTLALST
jgi:hypothetical protein